MATTDTNNIPTKRNRDRSAQAYEIPLDDSVPESFFEAAKQLVDSRLVEKIWDQFIETLTEETVYEGPLRDELDEDTRELGEFWVIEATMRRFGFQFVGVPSEYRTNWPPRHLKPGTYDEIDNDQEG